MAVVVSFGLNLLGQSCQGRNSCVQTPDGAAFVERPNGGKSFRFVFSKCWILVLWSNFNLVI